MGPRQVISTELARATIRILISWSELKYCLFLAFGRGSVLRIPISRLSISTSPDSPSPPESYLYMETTPCKILSSTAPTITGYSSDGNLSNYVSYISEISFHTHLFEDHAVIHGHGPLLSVYKKAAPPLNKGTQAEHTLQLSFELFYPQSLPWSDHHAGGILSGLAPALHLCSSVQVAL
ncbi:hypothetical protein Acr_17g0008600 [Actinidia rufa]|uniref:Uncharacterized protein n=1 Tax=Actinidia rufa TaxID=165716 RepID=A0A7J0G3E3_9ERIC|nr:hypothetical protein Acr_17g0008600 [Actinidia rufa]